MTPEQQKQLQEHIYKVAQILSQNTPSDKLQDLETIESYQRAEEGLYG